MAEKCEGFCYRLKPTNGEFPGSGRHSFLFRPLLLQPRTLGGGEVIVLGKGCHRGKHKSRHRPASLSLGQEHGYWKFTAHPQTSPLPAALTAFLPRQSPGGKAVFIWARCLLAPGRSRTMWGLQRGGGRWALAVLRRAGLWSWAQAGQPRGAGWGHSWPCWAHRQ